MTAPTITVATTGSNPKVTTAESLEATVNEALAIVYQTAIDAALASGGYADTAAGLADTAEGGVFAIASSDAGGIFDFYQVMSGSAVMLGTSSNLSTTVKGVAAAGYSPRNAEPTHAQFKVQVGNVWYSPDWITMVGAGQSGELANQHATDGPKTGNGDVYAWNGSAIVEATLGKAPFNTSGSVNNKLFHAAHKVSVEQGRPVLIVMTAIGGTSIATWVPGGSNWIAMQTEVKAALASPDLWGDEKVNLFSFGQGENEYDLVPMWTLADEKYPALIEGVQSAAWAADDLMFIAALPVQEADGGEAFQVTREWRRVVARGSYSNFFVASSDGLTLTGADVGLQVHLNGQSLYELGLRVASIYLGKSNGITDIGDFVGEYTDEEVTVNGRLHTLIADMSFDPADDDPDLVTVRWDVAGPSVVFDYDGVITSQSGARTLNFTVDSASASRLRVCVEKVPAYDQPVLFNVAGAEAVGSGRLRSLYMPRNAPVYQLYATGHEQWQGTVIASQLPRMLRILRIQSAGKLSFDRFVAADMPEGLEDLNLSNCLVPADVQDEIDAENAARGGMIALSHGRISGSSEASSFATVTEMTTAILFGFTKRDSSLVMISNATAGTVTMLQAKAGVAAVGGVSPAGWQKIGALS